ncbi:MAG: twin-arginine translocase TatA/TatE family subunit [Nitriliruptoraceae bacterium]
MRLSAPELVIILVIVLVLFGAKRLPGLASSIGTSIKEFRQATKDEDEDEGGDGADDSTPRSAETDHDTGH